MALCLVVILFLLGLAYVAMVLRLRVAELEGAQRATQQLLQEALVELREATEQLREMQALRQKDEADKEYRFGYMHRRLQGIEHAWRLGEETSRRTLAGFEWGVKQLSDAWIEHGLPLPSPEALPPDRECTNDSDEDADLLH